MRPASPSPSYLATNHRKFLLFRTAAHRAALPRTCLPRLPPPSLVHLAVATRPEGGVSALFPLFDAAVNVLLQFRQAFQRKGLDIVSQVFGRECRAGGVTDVEHADFAFRDGEECPVDAASAAI